MALQSRVEGDMSVTGRVGKKGLWGEKREEEERRTRNGGSNGAEKKRKGNGGGDVVSGLAELGNEGRNRKRDGEEVPSIDSPSEPTRKEHGALQRRKHHGELNWVKGSAIASDSALLLGGQMKQSVCRVAQHVDDVYNVAREGERMDNKTRRSGMNVGKRGGGYISHVARARAFWCTKILHREEGTQRKWEHRQTVCGPKLSIAEKCNNTTRDQRDSL